MILRPYQEDSVTAAQAALTHLSDLELKIEVIGDRLKISPQSLITDKVREYVRQNRDAIISELSEGRKDIVETVFSMFPGSSITNTQTPSQPHYLAVVSALNRVWPDSIGLPALARSLSVVEHVVMTILQRMVRDRIAIPGPTGFRIINTRRGDTRHHLIKGA